jgi:hypothetical protein
MTSAWDQNSEKRPSAKDLVNRFETILANWRRQENNSIDDIDLTGKESLSLFSSMSSIFQMTKQDSH